MESVVLLVPEAHETGPEGLPVLQPAPDSPAIRRVREVLGEGFPAQALRLDRFARSMAGVTEPLYLLLSEEDGGFARHGFWLVGDGERRRVDASYVELVADEYRLSSGDFAATFCHELGHVMLRTVLGDITAGPARKPHQSMVVTDYPTALDEGWAEHFEPLFAESRGAVRWAPGRIRDLIGTWLNRIDEQTRIDGVRQNWLVHRKLPPVAAMTGATDPFPLWRDDENSVAFDRSALKTGQAMMACEGVAATIFYRMVTSKVLQEGRCEPSFYARCGAGSSEALSPYENASLKVLSAMQALGHTPLSSGRPLVAELVEAYARLFPDEAMAAVSIFLETTWGTTVDPASARDLEALARRGRLGDLEGFRQGLGPARERLAALVQAVVAGERSLTEGLGPELWVLNEGFRVSLSGFGRDRPHPFALNMNTATEVEWMTIPGVGFDQACRLVRVRQERGWFSSLEELLSVDGVGPDLVEQLRAMQRRMAEAGDQGRI